MILKNKNSKTVLARFVNDLSEEIINLKGENFKSIAKDAFKRDDKIKAVHLPPVTEIGESAFEGCTNLSFIEIESGKTESGETENILVLQHNCFKNCGELQNVIICGYDKIEIEAGVFSDCSKLRTLYIDSADMDVSNNVFSDASSDFVLFSSASLPKIIKICRENEIKCKTAEIEIEKKE